MSVDPKKFGLTPSLLETVKEALKGSQHKIDVAPPHGKITGADFKKLRGEDKDKEQAVANEQTPGDYKKINYKHKMMKEGPEEKDKTNPKQGSSVDPKQRSIDEAEENPVTKQIAAKKDQLKKQIQQKIAQKQMQVMQSKAQKRLSNIHASNDKCTCGSTNESKMKCEVHGDDKEKGIKGGKEKIEINPPLKEAEELPKNVIKKGHEIAKSLIKHKSKVDNPYAVGMATAKKSAGIKD